MKHKASLSERVFSSSGVFVYIVLFLIPVLFAFSNIRFQNIISVVTDTYYLSIIGFTFFQALLSTFFSLLIGFPAACIISNYKFGFKKFITSLYSLSFILPPILVVLGFVVIYGNSGYLNKILVSLFKLKESPLKILYSFKAVILAHAFYNFPVIAHIISANWSTLSVNEEESAKCEGANDFQIFKYITFPKIRSSVLSASALVFLYCFTSFTIILVLGGGPAFSTVEVEIYRQARINMNTGLACTLSLISVVFVGFVLHFQLKTESKTVNAEQISYKNAYLKKAGLPVKIYLVLTTLFILLPLLGVVIRSFVSSTTRNGKSVFSLSAYAGIFNNPSVFFNSIITAISASLIGTITALSVSYLIKNCKNKKFSKILNTAIMFPLAVSSIILSLGYFLISGFFGILPPAFVLPFIHSILILPFGIRTLLPAYRALPVVLNEDARIQGAKENDIFFKVNLPMLKKPLFNTFLFGFAISIGEVNSSILLSLNSFPTLSNAIYQMVNSYNFQGACAAGSVLILITVIVFFLNQR